MTATKLNVSVPASLAEEIKAYGISPSAVCQPALRKAVEEAAGDADKIVVRTVDPHNPAIERHESFHGRWLVDPDSDDAISACTHDEVTGIQISDPNERWGVAVSRKGVVVVYLRTAGLLHNEAHNGIANCAIPDDIRERAIEAAKRPDDGGRAVIDHDW